MATNNISSFIVRIPQDLVETAGAMAQGLINAGGTAEVVLKSTFDATVNELDERIASLMGALEGANKILEMAKKSIDSLTQAARTAHSAIEWTKSAAYRTEWASRFNVSGIALTAIGVGFLYFALHYEEGLAGNKRTETDVTKKRFIWWVSTGLIGCGLAMSAYASYRLHTHASELMAITRG